jgi:DNA-binding transcriptional LysR family regulator
MRDIVPDFLLRYPKVNVVAHATDQNVDIVGENYDVAIRAHSGPLPDSTLVQRTLTPAPWLLFAGSAHLNAREEPQTPKDLQSHPSLFMMRTGSTPVWRLRHENKAKAEVAMRLTPRLLSDDMLIARATDLMSIPGDLSSVNATPLLCAGLTAFVAPRNAPAKSR